VDDKPVRDTRSLEDIY